MALLEILTLTLAPVIAKSVLKLWLKDQSLLSDIGSSIVDLLGVRVKDIVVKQSAKRQLEEVGEKISINLLPLFDDANLSESSKEAIALAVSNTLDKANLSADLLSRTDFNPRLLYNHLSRYRESTSGFSVVENEFYDRILEHTASYIVDVADMFPNITGRALAEILKRERELIEATEFVLAEVQRIRLDSQRVNQDQNKAFFEENYRRSITRVLDRPDVFGLTNLSRASQRYRISVAYISLSVIEERSNMGATNDVLSVLEKVEAVLARANKLIVRGLAGSGKTTLLKWLAVNSANSGFTASLSDWNDTIPFFIPLRRYVNKSLPSPEDFVEIIAPETAGVMPAGWVHECLMSKRAVILVDGIDEIPQSQRNDVKEWVDGLVDTYDNARVIVSSRPYAVDHGWLSKQGFLEADLQPLELQDVYAFIDHWHHAIEIEIDDVSQEVANYAEDLKEVVSSNRSIYSLATSPLLCAALCALHKDRHRHIPSSRVEIYEAFCEMLLERREKERRTSLEGIDYPELSYLQKRAILEHLAYWMVANNWSSVSADQVDRLILRKMNNVVGLPANATEVSIRQLLTDRSGIVREPSVGSIDFVHRTIQEFLAAKALLDNEDFGVLKNNIQNDQWHQVIILASGLANPRVRENIIKEIVQKGNKDRNNRHKYYLLALNCLESAVEVSSTLLDNVQKYLSDILPPRDENDIAAIASAKDLAIPYLTWTESHTELESRLCVKTLRKIGSDVALTALKSYISDTRPSVVDALVMASVSFDEKLFYSEITSHMSPTQLSVNGMISLETINRFENLRSLSVSNCTYLKDISIVSKFTLLKSLDLENLPLIDDLESIASCQELNTLTLNTLDSVTQFSIVSSLRQLQELNLQNLKNSQSLKTLFGNLHNLKVMRLSNLDIDFASFPRMNNLSSLYINGMLVKSLKGLAHLPNLRKLFIDVHDVYQSKSSKFELLEDLIQVSSLEEVYLGEGFSRVSIPKALQKKIRSKNKRNRA